MSLKCLTCLTALTMHTGPCFILFDLFHLAAHEPRTLTRFEAQKYAREAYELGVRYIGGCCAFDPYHIRAMSEELFPERQKVAPVTVQFGTILSGLQNHPRPFLERRKDPEIWKEIKPSTGRPGSSAFAKKLIM